MLRLEKQNSLAKASPTFHQLLQERTALEKRIDADLEKLRQYDAPKYAVYVAMGGRR